MSQNDSTYCFTKSQVKQFLITKTELKNCHDQYNLLYTENNEMIDTLNVYKNKNKKLHKRVKRNRIIAISSAGGLVALISLFLTIK